MKHWPNESRRIRFLCAPGTFVRVMRLLAALTIRTMMRIYLRLEIVGRENLPNDGSLVLVANHSSHLDTLCLLAALPLRRLDRAFPVAAADYFFQSRTRTWFAGVVLNALPFARHARIRESLTACMQVLSDPGNVLIDRKSVV